MRRPRAGAGRIRIGSKLPGSTAGARACASPSSVQVRTDAVAPRIPAAAARFVAGLLGLWLILSAGSFAGPAS